MTFHRTYILYLIFIQLHIQGGRHGAQLRVEGGGTDVAVGGNDQVQGEMQGLVPANAQGAKLLAGHFELRRLLQRRLPRRTHQLGRSR